MDLIDAILNLVCLLLWFFWRMLKQAPGLAPSSSPRLNPMVKRVGPGRSQRWVYGGSLLLLLLVRSLFYWHVGSAVDWTPALNLGPISVAFRSDYLGRMLIYSGVSFFLALILVYTCLVLCSAAIPTASSNAWDRIVRAQLGWINRIPVPLRLLLPWIVAAGAWAALSPGFAKLGLLPPSNSGSELAKESAVLGLRIYLVWEYALIIVFTLHLVNSYVYLGNRPLLEYSSVIGRTILRPLKILRVGKIDLAPIAGIAMVILLTPYLSAWLNQLFQRWL